MAGEIGLAISDKGLRPWQLDHLFRIGITGGISDPPWRSAANQCAIKGETGEVAQAKGTGCSQRDKQAITMDESADASSMLSFGFRHQGEAEIKQLLYWDQP